MDGLLDALGNGPLGDGLSQALEASPMSRRLVWVPDGPLHGFPLAALRLRDRYLVERVEIVSNFSGSWLVHQARARRWGRFPLRPMLVVTEARDVLPGADREGNGVAACFLRIRELHGPAATRAALRKALAGARAAHFACHAHFEAEHPLAARLLLPSGEALPALEWLNGLGDGLALVSLSACRSAEVAPLQGSEVFGLVTALLGGGVRAVMAGLWPVADSEAVPFMWHFYRHRLTTDLATALALAQRESLARADESPLFWSAFALFGDPSALPAPGPLRRWLARWLQARHARHFV